MSFSETVRSKWAYWRALPGFRRYGDNIFWLFLEKAVRILIGFSVGIFVARSLGPAQYGLLNYALGVVSIFAAVSGLGLEVILVRELVKRPEERDTLLGTAWGMRFIGALIALGIIAALVGFAPIKGGFFIFIIALGQLFSAFQVLELYFQAEVQGKYIALCQIFTVTVLAAVRFGLAWYNAPLVWFAWVEASNVALSSLGYCFFYWRCGLKLRQWRWNKSVARELLLYAWPVILSGGVSMIYTRCDQVLIVNLLSEADNGQYAVAQRLLELFYIVGIVICNGLFPSLIGTRHTSLLRYRKRAEMLIAALFYGSLVLLLPIACGGKLLIEVLYGPEYHLAGQLFSLYCLNLLLVVPGGVLGKIYLAENLQSITLWNSVIGAILYLPMEYVLLRYFGVQGAVLGGIVMAIMLTLVIPLGFRGGRYTVKFFYQALIFRQLRNAKFKI